jgi:hypothetical protein
MNMSGYIAGAAAMALVVLGPNAGRHRCREA